MATGDGGHVWPSREGDDRMELLTGSTTPAVDVVFKALGALGYTGSLDDRWLKYKVAQSYEDTSEPFTLESPPSAALVAVSGTLSGSDSDDVVAGGKTIIITLTGGTWLAAGTGPIGTTAQTQSIIDGITSAQAEAAGWNAEIRDGSLTPAQVARTSNTVATITLVADAQYSITAQETITVTVPAAVVSGATGVVEGTPHIIVGVA